MKTKLIIKDATNVDGNYWYHYDAVCRTEVDKEQLSDYKDHIKLAIKETFENSISCRVIHKLVVSPNYARRVLVYFNPRQSWSIMSCRMSYMEDSPIPPRHIWDKTFPNKLEFDVTIYHKVDVRKPKKKNLRTARVDFTTDYAIEFEGVYDRFIEQPTVVLGTGTVLPRPDGVDDRFIQSYGRDIIDMYREYLNNGMRFLTVTPPVHVEE